MNPEIERYLDEHGATYTPDALQKGHVGGVGAALVGLLVVHFARQLRSGVYRMPRPLPATA